VEHLAKVRLGGKLRIRRVVAVAAVLAPATLFAQTSPFETGANSLVTFATTIGTPIAVLVIIGLAIVAAVGKISWGWVIGAIVGIAAIFGAPTIVTWIRSMFGV
jgi:type IV secretion system protein VirB2